MAVEQWPKTAQVAYLVVLMALLGGGMALAAVMLVGPLIWR